MKTWILALAAAVCGVAIGVGITVAEFIPAEEVFVTRDEPRLDDEAVPPGAKPQAIVEGGTDHDFGSMERNVIGKHAFVIRNTGTAPLAVKVGHTSCKCTVAELNDNRLAPGESTKVELEWEGKGYVEDFRQTAEIETNDPTNPIIRLTIHGNIIQAVRPIPEEIDLSAISANEPTEANVKVYGFTENPLELISHSLVNAEYADHFDLVTRPLTEDEWSEVPQAKSGHLVTLKVKSGLPVGPVKQTIRLETNVPTAEVIEVPVHLTVASDISIISASPGGTFMAERNLLRLGKLKSDKGAKVRMYVMVKGPYSRETEVRVGQIEPDASLQATIGQPTALRDGVVMQYPLEVTIPPGTPPISRVGGEQGELGKIILNTTHPIAKEVRLFVQFAVE